jgi:hypothetical protein
MPPAAGDPAEKSIVDDCREAEWFALLAGIQLSDP